MNPVYQKKFEGVEFYGIDLSRKPKIVRFLRTLFSSTSAITERFWKAESILPDLIRQFGIQESDSAIFFYEDIPAGWLMRSLKPEFPSATHILRSHNVVVKGFEGLTRTGNIFKRWAWELELKKIYAFEKKIFALADQFYAISEDDSMWYNERMQISADGIIGCYLDQEFSQPVPMSGSEQKLVYMGSADLRKGQALRRFIRECWPLVRQSVPDAGLILGGLGTESCHDPSKGIIGLGFVESAIEVIRKGSIFINPQQVGAGIKIKSLIALASSRLLISTPVGVEGTGLKDGIHCVVAENFDEMADKIIRYLKNPEEQLRIIEQGKKFVEEEFSKERFLESMGKNFPQ